MTRLPPLTAFCALLMLGACALPSANDNVDPQFGAAVRNMIDQQIYDRHAAAQPPLDPPTVTDGERGAASLKTYRAQSSAAMPAVDSMPSTGTSTK